ncbi:MAG: PQQ-dependent sugar dehydrogenase [Egibacteraceae bacterium]
MNRRLLRSAAFLAIALTLAACLGDGRADPAPAVTGPVPLPQYPVEGEPPPAGEIRIRLTQLGTFDDPLAMAMRPGDPAYYVAEKGGQVRALRDGQVDPVPVLDLSDQVSQGGEQGLLGLAFSPDGRFLYVNYTNPDGDTRIVEFTMDGGQARPDSRRELIAVAQPYPNHNGGHLVFGPDGLLYIGLGDGGSGGDPQGNAQRLDTPLGKLLRIDPRPDGNQPYRIPADNPFVGQPGALAEIWSYGLRNPWRFSFDRQTGDMWIGDVGQNEWEEVSFTPASSRGGENYGWNLREGTREFRGAAPPGAVGPVIDYPLSGDNCAVTGGIVYRGNSIPALRGAYVYGDFCAGQLLGLRREGDRVDDLGALGLAVGALSSFGEDQAGELYVMSMGDGGLYRIDPA